MLRGRLADDRKVLRIDGADAERFLQDLVSNDVTDAGQGAVYAALLSPQGKYLFDFFLLRHDTGFLLDVSAGRAEALAGRLNMYRLRADVRIAPADFVVWQIVEGRPETGIVTPDPRSAALGVRVYLASDAPELTGFVPVSDAEMNRLRIENAVPETGIELIADETYILEAGFERLHGVSFRKGCYVGQEVTARMKHKTELRKGLVRVRVAGPVAAGTAVLSDGIEIGTLQSCEGDTGLAYLRLDRADGVLTAAGTGLQIDPVSSA